MVQKLPQNASNYPKHILNIQANNQSTLNFQASIQQTHQKTTKNTHSLNNNQSIRLL